MDKKKEDKAMSFGLKQLADSMRHCPDCTAVVGDRDETCGHCGADLTQGAQPSQEKKFRLSANLDFRPSEKEQGEVRRVLKAAAADLRRSLDGVRA